MNLAAHAHKFFLFGGAILLAVAVLQWLGRPRRKAGERARGGFDATMMRVGFFVAVGILAILVGSGVIPLAGAKP